MKRIVLEVPKSTRGIILSVLIADAEGVKMTAESITTSELESGFYRMQATDEGRGM